MRSDALATSSLFAGQPCPRRGALRRPRADGVTRRGDLHEFGSLRVRFPSPEDERPVRRVRQHGRRRCRRRPLRHRDPAGEGASLTLTTAAAEKVYRAPGRGRAAQHRAEGRRWRASRLAAAGDDPVRPGARSSPLRHRPCRGRLAFAVRDRGVRPRRDGRDHGHGEFVDRWRMRRGGRLVFAETVRLDGDIGAKLARSRSRRAVLRSAPR